MITIWDLKEQIETASNSLGIEVKILTNGQGQALFGQIVTKYADGKTFCPIWEHLKGYFSIQNDEAWKWVSDFIGTSEVILFFNQSEEKSWLSFTCGSDLVTVLGEMYSVEFYLTNKDTDYLLCFNHHDYLIATGKSIEWLKRYVER